MKIKFTKQFANYKKDDTIDVDGMIAASIIKRGFAKKVKPKAKKQVSNN